MKKYMIILPFFFIYLSIFSQNKNDRETYERYKKSAIENYEKHEFASAIKNATIALNTPHDTVFDKHLYLLRGISKYALADYGGAISDLTASITPYHGVLLLPDDLKARSYNYRANCYYKLKYANLACTDWSAAGELGSEDAYENIRRCCSR